MTPARLWQLANPERTRENKARWNASPVGKSSIKRWRENNRDRILARRRIYEKDRRDELRAMAMYEYGNKCACCGETRPEFLSIDHIEGGGRQHRLELKEQNKKFYHWLQQEGYPKGYRVLCMNCNTSRGFFGYCPHEGKVAA